MADGAGETVPERRSALGGPALSNPLRAIQILGNNSIQRNALERDYSDLPAFAVEDEAVGPVPSFDDIEAFLDFAPQRFGV